MSQLFDMQLIVSVFVVVVSQETYSYLTCRMVSIQAAAGRRKEKTAVTVAWRETRECGKKKNKTE